METRYWTEDEDDYLISFLYDREGETFADVAKFLDRTKEDVKERTYHLRKMPGNENLPYKNKPWSKKGEETLKYMILQGRMNHKEIADEMGRTEYSIKSAVRRLGFSKKRTAGKISEREEKIREMAKAGYTRREIAEKIGFHYGPTCRFIKSKSIECVNEKANQKYKEKQNVISSRKFGGLE